MDINDTNQSCDNSEDVKIVSVRLEQEPASNNAQDTIPDKIDSKNIAENEKTITSPRQQTGSFPKETRSCEIVANVLHSFKSFERSISKTQEKDDFLSDAFCDQTSATERSASSYTCNLQNDTLEPRILSIAENNDKDVRTAITRVKPTMESSANGTIIPNSGKGSFPMPDFNEDDDWNIYKPGFNATKSYSILESEFGFRKQMHQNKEYLSQNNTKSSIDDDSSRRVSYIVPSYSPSCSSVNNNNTFQERNKEIMLKEVKEYFLKNQVQVTRNLSNLESKNSIVSAPYFSREFAMRHGLSLPTDTPIQELNLLEDPSFESRMLAAYGMIRETGISEEEFFRYISLDEKRCNDISPWKWYSKSGLNESTIQSLDLIQERVGPDIFPMIYKQLRTGDEEFQAIFRDPELLNDTIQFWNKYEKNIEVMREQCSNIGNKSVFQNQDDNASNFIIEDTMVSQTNADSSSTTSRSDVVNTQGTSASNSHTDYYKVKAPKKIFKTRHYLKDLSKVESTEQNCILDAESKKCFPILESANQDNKELRSSCDSIHGHLNKSNESPGSSSIRLPHIRNSVDQNDEAKLSKVHSVKSKNSPNNATHLRPSVIQSSGEKSRDFQSGNSNAVLENVSNVLQSGVRKWIPQDEDEKSRKKIRLQENSNTDQLRSQKEENPTEDESSTLSQGIWPRKPSHKSCIVM